jgi:hypothetical protein
VTLRHCNIVAAEAAATCGSAAAVCGSNGTFTVPRCSPLGWITGPFPLLFQVTLSPISLWIDPTLHTLFDDAPRLTSVVFGMLFYPAETVLPWSQLTSINAESLITAHAADILREATVLDDSSSISAAAYGIMRIMSMQMLQEWCRYFFILNP